MKKEIVLVGAGNIGSRHLQAITQLPFDVSVNVVEPNRDAQKIANARLNEISFDKTKHHINWYKSLDKIPSNSDLVVVATNSKGRVNLINQLLELGHSRFLIEKMVCQSETEYENLLSKFRQFNSKGWVNANRRYFQSYQKIKDLFQDSKLIHLSVYLGDSGLGTASIHYLDLFSWFIDNYDIKLSGKYLLNKIFPNKRGSDYKEFAGTLIGSGQNGSVLTITTSFNPSNPHTSVVEIYGDTRHFFINETKEQLDIIHGESNDKDLKFEFQHASSTTTMAIQDIIENDYCLLPDLDQSYYAHKELFRVFNEHIYNLSKKEVKLCPIT